MPISIISKTDFIGLNNYLAFLKNLSTHTHTFTSQLSSRYDHEKSRALVNQAQTHMNQWLKASEELQKTHDSFIEFSSQFLKATEKTLNETSHLNTDLNDMQTFFEQARDGIAILLFPLNNQNASLSALLRGVTRIIPRLIDIMYNALHQFMLDFSLQTTSNIRPVPPYYSAFSISATTTSNPASSKAEAAANQIQFFRTEVTLAHSAIANLNSQLSITLRTLVHATIKTFELYAMTHIRQARLKLRLLLVDLQETQYHCQQFNTLLRRHSKF